MYIYIYYRYPRHQTAGRRGSWCPRRRTARRRPRQAPDGEGECIFIYMHTHTYIYIYIYYIHTYVVSSHIAVSMYIYIYIYIYTHVYVYMCVCVSIYIYIYIYTSIPCARLLYQDLASVGAEPGRYLMFKGRIPRDEGAAQKLSQTLKDNGLKSSRQRDAFRL